MNDRIPFDLDEARKDWTRVRSSSRTNDDYPIEGFVWSDGYISLRWENAPDDVDSFSPTDVREYLRLVPLPPVTVKLRMVRWREGRGPCMEIWPVLVDTPLTGACEWCSDPFDSPPIAPRGGR